MISMTTLKRWLTSHSHVQAFFRQLLSAVHCRVSGITTEEMIYMTVTSVCYFGCLMYIRSLSVFPETLWGWYVASVISAGASPILLSGFSLVIVVLHCLWKFIKR